MAKTRMFRDGFAWLKALPLLAVTAALTIMALATLIGAHSPDAGNRERLFDFYERLAPAAYDADAQFHLVLIDRESVDAVGPWPWPRTVVADLVDKARAAGASAVVLTEPVDAPDPLSPETIGAFWLEGASDDALAQELARLPRTDTVLAAALAQAGGAAPVSIEPPVNPFSDAAYQRADAGVAPWITFDGDAAEYLALPAAHFEYRLDDAFSNAVPPAIAAIPTDNDGVARRLPLLWALDEAPAPAIALYAARRADADAKIDIRVDRSAVQTQGRLMRSIELAGRETIVGGKASMPLYFPRRLAVSSTSAARLLTGNSTNSQLRDKVVLIGRDSELGGTIMTARGALSEPAAHALAAAQIVSGESPARPQWAGYAEALAVMLFGAGAIMLAQRLQFWQASGIALLISLLLIAGGFFVFSSSKILLDPLAPSLALFVGALSVAGGRSIGGALRDDSLRGSFHDTLPEPVMKRLREDGGEALLAGAYRDITVLACELRLADDDLDAMRDTADDATKVLAAASIELRQTIIDAGGAADQAEGGRIFAYFNAPGEMADHIRAGCAAALRLIEGMDKINASLAGSSRTSGVQAHLAIGVSTGRCFVGPMGHGRNNRYSAVGPAVDRAAFLRNQSEYYGPAMICDEVVYKETHHQFAYLELDRIQVRSAARPFSIYALIGNPFIKSSKGYRELDEAHRAMLAAYRAGDFAEAKRHLDDARKSPGAKISLFDIYADRIERALNGEAPRNWDGVTVARA